MVMERWRPRWSIRPWEPFRELEEMTRQFDDVFRQPLLPTTWRRSPMEMGWAPPIELIEKDDKFIVKAELPGMTKEDIDISVVGDTLTIKGERKAEKEVKEDNYYLCERSYGSFFRSIPLPAAVNAKKVEANYDDGVLEISLTKAIEVKPEKVAISSKKETGKKKTRK